MKPLKREVRETIGELMRTPVGRRWLLKAGFSAAAAGIVTPGLAGCGGSSSGSSTVSTGDLHFSLAPTMPVGNLRVLLNGQRIALTPHTQRTRDSLQSLGTLWSKLDTSSLTHFATVELPDHRAMPISVHGTRNGVTVVVAQSFHVPEHAVRALAMTAFALEGHYGSVAGSPERLASLGIDASMLESEDEIADLDRVCNAHSTAITFAMFHPKVATIDPTVAAATKSLLGSSKTPEVATLGSTIEQLQQSGQDWATLVPAVDKNGKPSQIVVGPDGTKPTTFSSFQLNTTDATFIANARSAVSASVGAVRDTGDLGSVIEKPLDESPGDTSTWHQPVGVVPTPTPYTPPTLLDTPVSVKIKDVNLLDGTYTVLNGDFSGGKVPLKLYNNFVRWISVYVQYLKADGTNLSLSSTPTFPDTHYAKHLGMLPQVFTLIGVPLWDTNTIEVTLDFPPEATRARLLYCGLGNYVLGNGWRQYFPNDAYPDRLAPSDEVQAGAMLTGIVSLGLSAFALATDFDIATTLKQYVDSDGVTTTLDALYELDRILDATDVLSGAEIFATSVATGGATYADVANNHGDLSNLWSILGIMGSVVPKLIFSKGELSTPFTKLAEAVLANEAYTKLLDAIPLVGELYAAISVAGDVATLAQASVETTAALWVTENEVSLTYPVSLSISRDPTAATWPVVARSWRLEAHIDGAVALAPVTGTLNPGGRVDSEPIDVQLTAPFGGHAITWSFVVLDGEGNQVGTGVSAKLANDDGANPPASVAFPITELPAVISADTLFQRADTVTYDSGYTWADPADDNGSAATGALQEITGVTIATRLGVAGIVWKQADKYWLRGVPVAENGNTITLGGATAQGFVRRPFLLFDSFVGEGDIGNHVLLEPEPADVGIGYHVRRLTLDPTSGALSWDPNTSHGYFPIEVSAAALHSSGRVIVVHTDSGRLGQVLPAATPRPPLAAYVAGSGTVIGLLQSPTAVAVTNPGVIIVLEAGASQLAAFDLNGTPIRYFGTGSRAFTLALDAVFSTYLDLAVDGAGQIYLLAHTGDGRDPMQYRVDVFTPTGAPILAGVTGTTNVPRLAVDYWRSIYAANFTPLLDRATGQPRIDPALGVAEPSLSRFDPTS